jgi:hypothetical protein
MGHGTIELEPPRNHTREALRAAAMGAAELARFARENVREAQRGLELARLAADAAGVRAEAAAAELHAYDAAGK